MLYAYNIDSMQLISFLTKYLACSEVLFCHSIHTFPVILTLFSAGGKVAGQLEQGLDTVTLQVLVDCGYAMYIIQIADMYLRMILL